MPTDLEEIRADTSHEPCGRDTLKLIAIIRVQREALEQLQRCADVAAGCNDAAGLRADAVSRTISNALAEADRIVAEGAKP